VNFGQLTDKLVVGLVALIGCFSLLGINMALNGKGTPDVTIVAFTGPVIGVVISFYFSAHNGAIAQAANSAASLSAAAHTELALSQQRRHADPAPAER
jgi:hypothetical protein